MDWQKDIANSVFSMHILNKLTDDNLLNPKRPLIFVPGTRTSRLAIRKEKGSLEHFWPLMPHEFLIRAKLDRVFHYLETNIRLKADDNDDDDDEVKVVATSLIPFAYDGLIKSVLTWGYKPNIDFWIFPYDWRQSNRISGHMLARFIEEKTEGKSDGVDIISHSMGGIITRAAYRNGAPIRRAAYIACPHLGSPLAYFILHPQIDSRRFIGAAYHNFPSGAHWQTNDTNNIEPKKTLYHRRKELFVKFPSMYELLPDEAYLRRRAILFADGKPTSGAEDTYLRNDWALENDMRTGVINAMEFKRELGEELPGQNVLLVCGTNQLTCDAIQYRTSYHASITERRANYLMQHGFSLPYDSGQGGDGYVPVTSAMASISGTPAYSNSVFIPEAHAVLPNAKATIEAISRFLTV